VNHRINFTQYGYVKLVVSWMPSENEDSDINESTILDSEDNEFNDIAKKMQKTNQLTPTLRQNLLRKLSTLNNGQGTKKRRDSGLGGL